MTAVFVLVMGSSAGAWTYSMPRMAPRPSESPHCTWAADTSMSTGAASTPRLAHRPHLQAAGRRCVAPTSRRERTRGTRNAKAKVQPQQGTSRPAGGLAADTTRERGSTAPGYTASSPMRTVVTSRAGASTGQCVVGTRVEANDSFPISVGGPERWSNARSRRETRC